jgi:hypothetical protein
MKRNNSDTSIGEKNGQANDSGVDTAVSNLVYFEQWVPDDNRICVKDYNCLINMTGT